MLKCKQCGKEWHNGLIVETPDRDVNYFCDWFCILVYAQQVYYKEHYVRRP